MRVRQFYSSSKGNLYEAISSNGHRLMLEMGVKWPLILKSFDYNLKDIDGALLTHAPHQDHCRAAQNVISAGIDIWASEGSLAVLGLLDSHRTHPVRIHEPVIISDTWEFLSFEVNHDAEQPRGFLIHDRIDDEYLYFSMDSSHIKARFGVPLSIIMIECSYQVDLLEQRLNSGNINEALAKRLLTSHASKATVMDYIDNFCNLHSCRQIHLLHTSAGNLDRPQAVKDFTRKFCIKTIIKGIH